MAGGGLRPATRLRLPVVASLASWPHLQSRVQTDPGGLPVRVRPSVLWGCVTGPCTRPAVTIRHVRRCGPCRLTPRAGGVHHNGSRLLRGVLPPRSRLSVPWFRILHNLPPIRAVRGRAVVLASLLTLVPLLQACSPWRLGSRQILHVMVVTNDDAAWLQRDFRDSRLWEPLLGAFRRLHPGVEVELTLQPEHSFTDRLRSSSERGLSPDLLLVRAPTANMLLKRGLVDPLPTAQADLHRMLQRINPRVRERTTIQRGMAGLPFFSEFTLACYDRRRVPQAPATMADLLGLAASGRPVGLAVTPGGIWWTVGAFGASSTMASLVLGLPSPISEAQDRAVLIPWLTALRLIALQSGVDLASSDRDLVLGLESGQLAWIPCFSISLHRLDRTLGRHLGVSPLPSGPGGLPTPYSSTRVWSLGRDSSPRQRQLALDMALLSLDPLVQREITLSTRMVVPANALVPLPVMSSSRLSALAAAKQQFDVASPMLSTAFSLDRLQKVVPSIEGVLVPVMVGAQTPQQGAEALLRLRPSSR